MPLDKKPGSEPIRGYRLIEPLGSGGFGEVWKCEAPGGIFKAIKFVYGDAGGLEQAAQQAGEELRAVQRIKSIRHPFLLSMDRVEYVKGELVIITELADQNLHQLLLKYRSQGQVGIPRAELLGYLRETAEVLDLLNLKFELQHLDIKPRNLFLVSNHVKVADFGLVQSLAASSAPIEVGAVTPIYAAPEVFQGKISRHSDQYSLAIVFQELLTATLPFDGKNARQLLVQHTQAEPDLSALSSADRPIVARALAKDPEHRFPSCLELVRALAGEPNPIRTKSRIDIELPPLAAPAHDTLTGQRGHTQMLRKLKTPQMPAGVLEGYIVLEAAGSGPLSDAWKMQSPDGEDQLVKFIYGVGNRDLEDLKATLARLRSMRHPALVLDDVVHIEPGRLIVVSDIGRETLRDRFLQCQARKLPGIRRGELADYLRATAEVLDYLSMQHGVQHLGLNPRQLILDHGWLQICEFGLAQLLWLPAGQDVAQRNKRYAAPESFARQLSSSCDQYSLGIIYAEMLTGTHPFHGQAMNANRGAPDLAGLPELDRQVITRALDLNPIKRWSSATEMVMALEGTPPELEKELRSKPDRFDTLLKHSLKTLKSGATISVPEDINRLVREIITHASGAPTLDEEFSEAPVLSQAGDRLTHNFHVGTPIGAVKQKLESFPQQWFGQNVHQDDKGLSFQVTIRGKLWQRLMGRDAGITIRIELARVHALSATPIQVTTIVTRLGNNNPSQKLFDDMGPTIIDSLRQHLLVDSDKRTQKRLLWPEPVKVIPIGANGEREEAIECRGKDISQSGMGLYFPHELATSDVLIELPRPGDAGTVTIPATLVRARRCADDWYDVGALFRIPIMRKTAHDLCLPVLK